MAQGTQEIKQFVIEDVMLRWKKGNTFLIYFLNFFSTLILKPIHLMNFCMDITYYKHKKCIKL